MTDPALCADGCGTLATRERPYADNRGTELVCDNCGGTRMSDWLDGWLNWLKWFVYPLHLRRIRCRLTEHRSYQIDQTMWCTRCGDHESVESGGFVVIGCASCPAEIEVPYTYYVTEPDEDGHQSLLFDPDMADLWAHSWTHQETE